MAPPVKKALLVDYDSDSSSDAASDSDFAPDAAVPDADAEDSDASSDSSPENVDPSTTTSTPKPGRKRKRRTDTPGGKAAAKPPDEAADAEDVGFENSGDEAIISKGRKKRRRKDKDGDGDAGAGEEGGEGGWVKTRAMRAAEKEEKQYKLEKGPVTIDVDALWAQMISGPAPKPPQQADAPPEAEAPQPSDIKEAAEEDMVLIKRSYNFAGKLHTEEKLVPRSSAEARLYLASQSDATAGDNPPAANATERPPPRRAFRSVFEPVSDVATNARRSDLDLSMRARDEKERARKLNTVEKSRMDWAGFVDKEGIKDELDLAGRAKGSWAGRQEFLARSEMRREQDARRARMAARV